MSPAAPCTGSQPGKQSSGSKNNPPASHRSAWAGGHSPPPGLGNQGLITAGRKEGKTDHGRSRRCSVTATFSHRVQTSRQGAAAPSQHPQLQANAVTSVIAGSNHYSLDFNFFHLVSSFPLLLLLNH